MIPAKPVAEDQNVDDMRRSYVRVLITWVLVLVGLLAFQEYFS